MAGAADNPEEKEGPVRALDEDDIAAVVHALQEEV